MCALTKVLYGATFLLYQMTETPTKATDKGFMKRYRERERERDRDRQADVLTINFNLTFPITDAL